MNNLLRKIQTFFLGLYFLSKPIIGYCNNHALPHLGSLYNSFALWGSLLISLIIINAENKIVPYFKVLFKIAIVFSFIFISQSLLCPQSEFKTYISSFYIVGIGGFTIGYSLFNCKSYIKFVGVLSAIAGLFLIPEPLTNSMLGVSNMAVGYTMAPLCVYMILSTYYIKRNLIIKIIAIACSLSVILFTSRGCGLTILLFLFISLWWSKRISKKKIITLVFIIALILVLLIIYFSSKQLDLAEGSLLGKLSEGVLDDDNGRIIIQEYALQLIKEHPLTGLGIGVDRNIIINYVDEYPFIHNFLLEFLLNYGIIITPIILWLYFTPIFKALNVNYRIPSTFLLIALLCSVWFRLLVSDSYLNNIYGIMLTLGLATSMNYERKRMKNC